MAGAGKSHACQNGSGIGKDPKVPKDVKDMVQKTQLCKFYMAGSCKRGGTCLFAHSQQELKPQPDLSKTSLCRLFKVGNCQDAACKYAHGRGELRGFPRTRAPRATKKKQPAQHKAPAMASRDLHTSRGAQPKDDGAVRPKDSMQVGCVPPSKPEYPGSLADAKAAPPMGLVNHRSPAEQLPDFGDDLDTMLAQCGLRARIQNTFIHITRSIRHRRCQSLPSRISN
eukprot:gb/GFBE01069854.1/.p1 GENE.gb/GFBE01069854.1/~~gb/GFBE01069854.1/.p1  ORF type:complete len:226 (+),score=21.61 gb/GFBE01069854.1/:1-678(+)